MAIGSFMGRTFTVSDRRIFTPSNLKGQSGSDWATHDRTGAKARSQWIAPKLKSYSFDLLLRAQDGASPRSTLEALSELRGKRRGGLLHRGKRAHLLLPVQDHGRERRVGGGAAQRGAGGVQGDADHRGVFVGGEEAC